MYISPSNSSAVKVDTLLSFTLYEKKGREGRIFSNTAQSWWHEMKCNGADGTVAACAGASSTGSITDCPVPVKSVYWLYSDTIIDCVGADSTSVDITCADSTGANSTSAPVHLCW